MSLADKLRKTTNRAVAEKDAAYRKDAEQLARMKRQIDAWLTYELIRDKAMPYVEEQAMSVARNGKNLCLVDVRETLAKLATPGKFPAIGNLADNFRYYNGYDGEPDIVACGSSIASERNNWTRANDHMWHRFRDMLIVLLEQDFEYAKPFYTDIMLKW